MKETPETIAELVALAKAGWVRPYDEADFARVNELAALSEAAPEEALLNDPNWFQKNKNEAYEFWIELTKGPPCSEHTRLRDKNISFIKNAFFPHLLRVMDAPVKAVIEKASQK